MTRGFEGTALTEIEEIFPQEDEDRSPVASALRQRLLGNASAAPITSGRSLRERLLSASRQN